MNYSVIIRILGYVLGTEGALMLLPCLVAWIYGEKSGWSFLICSVLYMICGWIMSRTKAKDKMYYAKEGFTAVALSWIVLAVTGSVPFVLSGEIPHVIDALFETVSGFTTTGASILSEVESLSHCVLFWRSFTHWIGGMGVLVFIMALLPMVGGSSIHLMRAESPGPSVGKLVPRIRNTAMLLYGIYIAMTGIQIVLLLMGGMPLFDTVTLAFGTAGTGGFGIRNDSIASYNMYCQAVITIFMILFGVNFNVYYYCLIRKPKLAFKIEEFRYYLLIIGVAILLITANIQSQFASVWEAFHHAAFQVGSIITTTGYSTVDFGMWPYFSQAILVLLMFIGACAGSTGGGIKVSRVVMYYKTIKKELAYLVHPRSVKVIKSDDKPVEHEVLRSANVFLITYLLIFVVSIILITVDNFDLTTNFTAVAATLNNIGPGLGEVGPVGNFGGYSDFSKLVFIFNMLAGRLELFPMLILFAPSTWRK